MSTRNNWQLRVAERWYEMVKNKILKRIVAGLSCIALSTTMLTSLPAFADDYVDEYQYYSTLDPNGEEYQEWKSNLASSAVSVPQNRMLKSILKNNTLIANDYIEFNTANNNLTSNAIEETKTLSNKLAISGYFDLFFSNETCSYYYTNSEVHEGNNLTL